MTYMRMLDKEHEPTEAEIQDTLGEAAPAWVDLRQYIADYYTFMPEMDFGGKNYGWMIRYRRSGKTLCSLYPERGAFTALVVLGRQESEKAFAMIDELTPHVAGILRDAKPLHDGRWLWIRVISTDDADSIKRLLAAKRKPKKRADA